MADNMLTMFGKTYNTVGSANTNLMLQTKGDLKIRWGNKFIDLVKNGKINTELDVIKTANSVESISENGIYLVKNEDKDEIWVKVGKTLINLNQEVPQEYISYKEKQELTNEERDTALSNMGLIFDTYSDLVASGIKNGFAYITETKKFFHVVEGNINEYVFDTKVSDPLEIGNITITGSIGEIASNSRLQIISENTISFKTGEVENVSLTKDKINCSQYISSDKGIQSSNYSGNVGYFVGIDNENKAIGVFDEIIVRNGLKNIKRVTYSQIMQLITDKQLITNCEYEIIDFQDIRNVTYDTNYEDYSSDTVFKPKNVYPIIVKAKNSSKLYSEGYFSENPEWIIEYDPYYYHVVTYEEITSQEHPSVVDHRIAYSKGRITKMTDEFGNTANFDFKHSTFSDDKKYLFNIANPRIKELDKLIEIDSSNEVLAEKSVTNIYADATQDIDVTITIVTEGDRSTAKFERIKNTQIVNNTIYLAEPKLIDCPVVSNTKMLQFNDYIIFDDCSTLTPSNNYINSVEGKYKILKQFDNNTINSLIYNDEGEYQIFPIFTNNTADIIYLKYKREDVWESVLFNIDSTYDGNIFGNISNSDFRENLIKNSFKNVRDLTVNNAINNNSFNNIDGCVITGNVNDCTFQGLSGGIQINGPLNNIVIETDMTPTSADYVESNGSYIQNSPFIISLARIPKLSFLGEKTCNIELKTYNNQDINVFVVKIAGNIPSGAIIMFDDSTNQIPDGWVVCDGTNGTPDLSQMSQTYSLAFIMKL